MAHGRQPPPINPALRNQVIHAPMKSPGPRRDGAPVRRFIEFGVAGLLGQPMVDAVRNILAIGINVRATKRRQSIPALQDARDWPISALAAPGGFGGFAFQATFATVVKPNTRQRDTGIIRNLLIDAEVLSEKDRKTSSSFVGEEERQTNLR